MKSENKNSTTEIINTTINLNNNSYQSKGYKYNNHNNNNNNNNISLDDTIDFGNESNITVIENKTLLNNSNNSSYSINNYNNNFYHNNNNVNSFNKKFVINTKKECDNNNVNQTIINGSSILNTNIDYLINHNKILNFQQQTKQATNRRHRHHRHLHHHNHPNQNDLIYYNTKNLTKINRSSVSILSAPVPLISGAGAAAAGITLPQNEVSPVTTALETIDDTEAIKCIFLCEFHVTAGRKITVQVPENYLSKEKFETVSRYVIPHAELQRSFLCLSLLGIKILGYPVRIDNKQYARNAFYFNLCFVFAPTTRTIGYEPIVKKLSEYLLSMEKSSRLLSQQSYASVEIGRLARILTQVRNDINSKKVCMLQEGSTLIPMCVVPRYLETVIISPHHAAALTDDFYKYVTDQWDLATLRILPYIDGFNHVNRITALADVAPELVCDCLRHLVLLGVAVLVPVFQYNNIYRPTPKLSELAKDRQLQQKCIQRCSKSERKKAKIRDIFRFFASMAHGATFGELCVRFNPQALNINEKQMVLFGQLEGIIRRVEKYPVTVKRDLFADDVDNITKRKLGPVAGQTPNTPVFEQQQQLKHQYQIPLIIDYPGSTFEFSNHSPTELSDSPTGRLSLESNEDYNIPMPHARRYRRLPSKPIPRSGRAAAPTNSFLCNTSMCRLNNNSNDSSKEEQKTMYNGLQSFDEICSATGLSCQQLDYHLARDKHVIVLLK